MRLKPVCNYLPKRNDKIDFIFIFNPLKKMVLTEAEKKERRRISNQKWREKNKEYGKKWREKNKEYDKEYSKEWREKNKEYNTKRNKEYHKNNPHTSLISCWKRRGLISDDYKALYDEYFIATHCQVCDKEFNKESPMNYKCMDHDHDTGEFRCFACGDCNINNRMIK